MEGSVSGGSGNSSWEPAGGLLRFRTSDTLANWTMLNAIPPAPKIRMSDYMASLGTPGTTADFGAQCKIQSKANWRDAFTAKVVNAWARQIVGVAGPANP